MPKWKIARVRKAVEKEEHTIKGCSRKYAEFNPIPASEELWVTIQF